MTYTIKLSKADTECLRQTVTEAYKGGQEVADAKHAKEAPEVITRQHDYYGWLLQQIEHQAQRIAEEAFEAGRKSPPLG
jgi:hypothetical protein